jgi:hypothetical protein
MKEMKESLQSESGRHVHPASRHAERGHDMQQGRELPWQALVCPGMPRHALAPPAPTAPTARHDASNQGPNEAQPTGVATRAGAVGPSCQSAPAQSRLGRVACGVEARLGKACCDNKLL